MVAPFFDKGFAFVDLGTKAGVLSALNAANGGPPPGIAKGVSEERWMYLGDRRVPISAAKKPGKRSLNNEHLRKQHEKKEVRCPYEISLFKNFRVRPR